MPDKTIIESTVAHLEELREKFITERDELKEKLARGVTTWDAYQQIVGQCKQITRFIEQTNDAIETVRNNED